MKRPLFETENKVRRTYRGGRQLDIFLDKENASDGFTPEDWISSVTEAKNKDYIKGEGISHVLVDGSTIPLSEAIGDNDLGGGRTELGILVKLLDAGERLGIQVHPTPEFSRKYFGCSHGKTECWHILHTEDDAAVYIGFKEGVTREEWARLFENQDIEAMLNRLHRIPVKEGDTILVKAGTPHAIGKGCFLLEIQEPTDYTMRVEKTTVAGEKLTPMQIHYGLGDDTLLDCFVYEGLNEIEARKKYFIDKQTGFGEFTKTMLVTYDDTPCFALGLLKSGESVTPNSFVTLIAMRAGALTVDDTHIRVKRGNKLFVPYGCGKISCIDAEMIVCYPPKI